MVKALTRYGFVKEQPLEWAVERVIAAGAKRGLQIKRSDVHVARHYMRKANENGKGKARSMNGHDEHGTREKSVRFDVRTDGDSTTHTENPSVGDGVVSAASNGGSHQQTTRQLRVAADQSVDGVESRFRGLAIRVGLVRAKQILAELGEEYSKN